IILFQWAFFFPFFINLFPPYVPVRIIPFPASFRLSIFKNAFLFSLISFKIKLPLSCSLSVNEMSFPAQRTGLAGAWLIAGIIFFPVALFQPFFIHDPFAEQLSVIE